ncbi:MAG TPA: metallophosphoesterase, partial [Anaeromyxobacteraceae bacterium]|nr:metallophosphoesterase [Anaeromyxobacteraceae bacterium]
RAVTSVWIASDWHLGPESPPGHGRLAGAFLARARAAGARVILNGDVFDDLFWGAARAAAAHPGVAAEVAALAREGRLERTSGNHDPQAGPLRLELSAPGLGRVLVTHGHAVDPLNASPLGRLGDRISRRFGRLALVRGAAALAEASARALAGPGIESLFRRRCLELLEREGFDLGVFGHVHAAHLVPGDRYANSGALLGSALGWLELGANGPRLGTLRENDLGPDDPAPGAPVSG